MRQTWRSLSGVNTQFGGTLMRKRMKEEKKHYAQLHKNFWIARGSLPFKQGIDYIYNMFAGKSMADVYNHPYLVEAEHWPEQPSPQMQLTEEVQSVLRIAKGMFREADRTSMLDNTMSIVRDPSSGRFLLYNPVDLELKTREEIHQLLANGDVTDIVVPSRQTWQSLLLWTEKYPQATVWHAGSVPIETFAGKDIKLRYLPTGNTNTFEPNEDPIFPHCNFYQIPGDQITNEHVLFHDDAMTLSCTDLYHGPYTDYDPLNTWLCRFWFKQQRLGDHKSKVFLPHFRKTQIESQKAVRVVQETVDLLTRVLPMEHLVFSHGTPPLSGLDAVTSLRAQYALK